ncbi:hypothetical protein [Rhizobium ruizarguesonis]|uniref:hypothetical protein n=1 Tax=Rhizobium ruizarguesonis TaxID=2081791 RepID=UPI0010322505|nr:hypothetical protein [Rhizobium ruizarguesonis]TAV14745.1 hypothetical protein ELI34_04355 [Rhizobium ruizarguesonis]
MKRDIADKLALEYNNLWDDSMSALPDGWITPLVTMLDKLEGLSNVDRSISYDAKGLATWVDVQVEVSAICASAYAAPLKPAGKWNPARALACIEALSEFSGQCSETCSICGQPGLLRMPNIGDPVEGVLCDVHHAEAASKVDRAAELYNECRILFPGVHGKAIDLHVPDYLFDLLASCLRKVKEVATDEGGYLEGKVQITRIEMIEGQLHVRHVYDKMPAGAVAAMIDIDDTLRYLEAQADELTRKHGGSNAAS